jgi:hypothetical protein
MMARSILQLYLYDHSRITEFDHFRSTQIRDGKLAREKALKLVQNENRPRFEAIEWYANAVDFDCNKAISIINSVPKLYNSAK